MHDTTDDHDMADDDVDIDLEEGGVPLTGTHTSDSDIISPFTGSAIFTQPSYETTNFDDSISLDGEYEMPPIAPLGPVIEPGLPSPTPTPPGMGISFAQLMATTVPAWAQQVLPSIPAHQAQAHEQVPAQLAAQHPLLVQQQQQQLFGQQQLQFFNDLDDEFGDAHGALPMSNSNHFTLGPDNLSLADFLRAWARSGRPRHGEPVPRIDEITTLLGNKTTNRIEYEDLVGDAHDFQGIDWTQLEAPRSKARDRRRATYRNFVNKAGSDKWHVSCSSTNRHLCLH